MTYVHEDDAPDYSSACAWDVRLVHKTRKEAQAHERERISQGIGELLAGLPKSIPWPIREKMLAVIHRQENDA